MDMSVQKIQHIILLDMGILPKQEMIVIFKPGFAR